MPRSYLAGRSIHDPDKARGHERSLCPNMGDAMFFEQEFDAAGQSVDDG
jgi:hypothetical protein